LLSTVVFLFRYRKGTIVPEFYCLTISGGSLRVCLLASGSKGNSLFVETGETKILVDAGLSAREIAFRLESIGVSASELNGILISHEHVDHIRGAGTLARRFKIPVLISYSASNQTHEHFRSASLVEFESGCSFEFRDTLIDPFPTTHDSADPVGFVIDGHEARIGFATDLGIVTRLVQEKLRKSRVLVLESNHDEDMLLNGPYPWHLKQRIKSRHGHLSNLESAELLAEVLHPDLEGVFLAHLSEANNLPEIALGVCQNQLSGSTVCSPRIFVGKQQGVTEILSL
jgi:phosphoribosyl 1,2-cyclic phosphodiesterase